MIFISHRRNTIEELIATPIEHGIEVDIRSSNGRLIIQHEPLKVGIDFEDWLKYYLHKTLILNVKEEGLEAPLIALMQQYCINDFFFLDQSFPFLIKWSQSGERHCAVRVSEYESIETAMGLAGKIDWVWVDFFTHFPLSTSDAMRLQNTGFKLCLVSPELHGHLAEIEIPKLARLLKEHSIEPEAICTKQIGIWEECLRQLAKDSLKTK